MSYTQTKANMRTISYNIMACLERKGFTLYLLNKLGQNTPIIWDEKSNVWDTRKRCLENHIKQNKDYCLTIQDDAIIGKDFHRRVQKEIEKHPDKAISFYFGYRKRLVELAKTSKEEGGHIGKWLHWGLAVCLPRKTIEGIIKLGDNLAKYHNHDDTIIAKYLSSNGIEIWFPNPSLVEHRAEIKSIVNQDILPNRKAFNFIGE